MLDIERFQTVFKGMARGTKNPMQSILNHYQLREVSDYNRLVNEYYFVDFFEYIPYRCKYAPYHHVTRFLQVKKMSWTKAAKRSTSAGFAARSDVLDKSDRMVATKGSSTWDTLSSAELKQVQEIWGEQDQDYGQFLGRFERKMAKLPVNARVENVNDWVAPDRNRRTPQERQWQTMTSDIKVTYQRYEPFPGGTERTNLRMHVFRFTKRPRMLGIHSRQRGPRMLPTPRLTTPTSATTT